MNPRSMRLIGALLIAGAVLGFVIGVTGLGLSWWAAGKATSKVMEAANSADQALEATDELLVVVQDALGQAEARLADVETTVDDVAGALDDTAGSMRVFGDIASGDLPKVVEETRTALYSVATTARLVDSGLRVISSLPFVDTNYQPDVPLQTSIAGVSDALAPVPDQLERVSSELETAATNIETIRDDVKLLTSNLSDIETSLRRTAEVAAAYRETVADIQAGVDFARDNIQPAMRLVRVFALLLALWVGIMSVGMFAQGWALWRGA